MLSDCPSEKNNAGANSGLHAAKSQDSLKKERKLKPKEPPGKRAVPLAI
jgi:hypothetical protein